MCTLRGGAALAGAGEDFGFWFGWVGGLVGGWMGRVRVGDLASVWMDGWVGRFSVWASGLMGTWGAGWLVGWVDLGFGALAWLDGWVVLVRVGVLPWWMGGLRVWGFGFRLGWMSSIGRRW